MESAATKCKSLVVWKPKPAPDNTLGNMRGLYGGPIDPIVQRQMEMLNGYYRHQAKAAAECASMKENPDDRKALAELIEAATFLVWVVAIIALVKWL